MLFPADLLDSTEKIKIKAERKDYNNTIKIV